MATKKSTTVFDYKKIKTFEDACKKENIDPLALPDVSMIPEEFRKAIIGVYRLFIIFKAINNGWTPDWNNTNQWKYYPYFQIKASDKKPSGFGFSYSFYDYWFSYSSVCSRLCCENSEKALYIARQFEQEYIDFFLITD